jgi:hypothetical protein
MNSRVLPGLVAAVVAVAAPRCAHAVLCTGAKTLEEKLTCVLEKQVVPILSDLDVILTEGPKYLATRLPAYQAMGDLGADMDLEEFGDFSITAGVGSAVFRDFNDDVAQGFQRLPKNLPEPLPLPSILLGGRFALSRDWEITGRFTFVPEFEIQTNDWLVSATTRTIAAGARYRLYEGDGGVPRLVTSAELSYFTGYMKVGRDFQYDLVGLKSAAESAGYAWEPFRQTINAEYREQNGGEDLLAPADDLIIGTLFRGAPILGWDIVQMSVEQRATWALGFWHPVLGLGLDAAGGEVDSGLRLAVDLRITKPKNFIDVAGNLRTDVLPDQNVTVKSVKPRAFGARGIVGWEFDLGSMFRLPMEGQYDFGSGSFMAALALRMAWK